MLKLPVCPYCKAVYRYGDVRNLKNKKNERCHHCKRSFRVSVLKGRVVLISCAAALLIVINLLLINIIEGLTILGCFVITAILIAGCLLLFPYTVRFYEIEGERNKAKDSAKPGRTNKHRHRKKQSDEA